MISVGHDALEKQTDYSVRQVLCCFLFEFVKTLTVWNGVDWERCCVNRSHYDLFPQQFNFAFRFLHPLPFLILPPKPENSDAMERNDTRRHIHRNFWLNRYPTCSGGFTSRVTLRIIIKQKNAGLITVKS